jgi:plastocyanin
MQVTCYSRVQKLFISFTFFIFAVGVALGQGGTVVGTIHLTAAAPANPVVRMGADPNCLKINAGKRVFLPLVNRSSDGGLENVFVYVKGSFPQAHGSSGNVTLDQKGCMYQPDILAAQVGQTLVIKNSDATLHNVHSLDPSKKYNFDQAQPPGTPAITISLKDEEAMLHFKCNIHPWMSGYIGIVSSPYFAVSDDAGKFKIENVPAGKQTIEIWHQMYGPLTQTVDVKAGGTTTADFTYTGNEHPAEAKSLPIQEITIPEGTTTATFIPPAR